MINKFKTFLLLGILIIGIVFISGCVQEKTPIKTNDVSTTTPTGTIAEPATTKLPVPKTVLIEETEPSFVWSGEWKSEQNPGASGGSWKVTTYMPSSKNLVNITFSGTGIKLKSLTCDNCGIAKINIDGKSYPDIDMYSSGQPQFLLKDISTNLTNSEHILTISVSNEKNPASTGNNILVDAIEVTVLQ